MNLQTFLLYLGTWSLVALTPGPAVMCAMTQSTRYGFRPSVAGIAGIQLGNFLFFVSVALGLAALLETATTAFTILRVMGAAYLFYLGARTLLSTFRPPSSLATQRAAAPPVPRSLFLQGLLIQITNPKALLFVSALLPQFIDRHRPALLQLAILVATTIAIDTAVLSSYSYFAERGAQSFRSSRFSNWMQRIFGAALVFLGFRLLASRK